MPGAESAGSLGWACEATGLERKRQASRSSDTDWEGVCLTADETKKALLLPIQWRAKLTVVSARSDLEFQVLVDLGQLLCGP